MATLAPDFAATKVAHALRESTPLRVVGATSALRGLCLAKAIDHRRRDGAIVFVAADEASARAVLQDTAFFLGAGTDASDLEGQILVIPEVDVSPYADVSPDPRAVAARLAALARLADDRDPPALIVVSVRSLLRRVLPRAGFESLCSQWSAGDEIDRDDAATRLVEAGYQRVDVVEDPGTFAVRGGVMDLFVPRSRFPTRIEWFGDEIERLRLFDPQSQRSLRDVNSCTVHPVRETVATAAAETAQSPLRSRVFEVADQVNAPSSRTRQVLENLQEGHNFFGIDALVPIFHAGLDPLWSYFPAGAAWLVEQPDALLALAEHMLEQRAQEYARVAAAHTLAAEPESFFVQLHTLRELLEAQPVVANRLDLYDESLADTRAIVRFEENTSARLRLELEQARKTKGAELLRPVVEHIRRLRDGDDPDVPGPPWSVVIAAPNMTHAERLTGLLRGYGLEVRSPRTAQEDSFSVSGPSSGETQVQVIAGELSSGYASMGDRFLLLSEADIFGRSTRKTKKRSRRTGLGSLSQLAIGDVVVHMTHGVGKYAGLKKLALTGVPADFVLVEYAGSDKLYLPVYRLSEIDRFVSAEAKPPKLDRMGGTTFATKTAKVKAAVRQIAEELLQIYAQREAQEGFAFERRGELYDSFEATFPFEETSDQHDAIEAVQADLSRPQPMDRLVCGDVGFGKTEVALRAAFRVAVSGRQVAILAPTTVLVQQHHMTFRERMEGFGLKVARLNRLVSSKERKEILAGIRDGSVDVVIGTHRLLSRDVRFRDLGLVVIDEEQRFGVAQKERFKKLKTEIDVLTLSATPIPRTLHMSLLGIREISLITTPPVDRLAVRTYLTRPSDTVLDEGIRKELARGGQVFYVVPKILGIEEHASRIRSLVPDARVLVAHGQMPAQMLEKAMIDFVEHRADVLVSTTIIESGLDIPRANTMFIARADMFGLSQLYQLRGRIGRSKLRAFCYMMVASLEKLPPDTRRRLEAIVRFAELGSGFNVASQDMEIRGAGEILGGRQSGQIQAIGFEAYSRILQEAVAELRGDPIARESDPEIVFDVPAFLPDTYVEDTGQRLDLYRRLSAAEDIDGVKSVVEEIRDRFGDLPEEAANLGLMMGCKTYGRRLRATALELRGDRFTVRLGEETPLGSEVAAGLGRASEGRIRLVGADRIVVQLPETTRRRVHLEACQSALGELVTYL